VTLLLPQHLADLRRSGLSDETIAESGIYSESDRRAVSRLLGWDRPAPSGAMVIPFSHPDGTRNGFARAKLDQPRKARDGKPVKYEQPRGQRLRAYFTGLAIDAIKTAGAALWVVEGEKKALRLAQAGYPTIGLTGVFSWHKPRPKEDGKGVGERELIGDLAVVGWTGRTVGVLFDTDPFRNPAVNQAQAELLRVLSLHGALPFVVTLPLGPRDQDGLPKKMGVDDFLVEFGEEELRKVVERHLAGSGPIRRLAEVREEIAGARVGSIGRPGAYFDGSPPGTGKSTADIPAARLAKSSLTVLLTHGNCEEVADDYRRNGLDAASYPKLTKETCANYDEAVAAIEAGLSASSAVCPGCMFRSGCEYQSALTEAGVAPHRLATHHRAQLSFEALAKDAKYITIHEDAAKLLRPFIETSTGLDKVVAVVRAAKDTANDRDNMDLYHFFWRMEDGACKLAECLQDAERTVSVEPPGPCVPPRNAEACLWGAMLNLGIHPPGDAVRIVKGWAAGDLKELSVRVDKVFGKGGQDKIRKSLFAVWQTDLPPDAAVWLSDGTADHRELELMAGRPVANMTPVGTPERRHQAVQIPMDVTKATVQKTVLGIVRGVLAAFPGARRIGIICHREHVACLSGTAKSGPVLEEHLRERIAKIEYFRSGEGRGSNQWLDACDFILVLGTPRVPPAAVRSRLLQTGRVSAAARDGRWDRDYWSGVTAEGERRTIRTSAYRDWDWHHAHRAIVRAELVQAIGRARGICDNGLPVAVVSNESLDLPILAKEAPTIGETELRILQAIVKLSAVFPKGEPGPSASAVFPNRYWRRERSAAFEA
jgi:hypothetical protein